MDDKELISKAIKASGLSVRAFAREVLVREPRTVWRWLAGENALPVAVRSKCQALLATQAIDATDQAPTDVAASGHALDPDLDE